MVDGCSIRMMKDGHHEPTGTERQYLSSLLQLAFVISKLLLKTDLLKKKKNLKKGTTERQETDKEEFRVRKGYPACISVQTESTA